MNIDGLEKLQRDLKGLETALASLNGTITQLEIDPDDESSIQTAIRHMEQSIDQKVAAYGRNEMVSQIIKAAKSQYREQILDFARNKKKA